MSVRRMVAVLVLVGTLVVAEVGCGGGARTATGSLDDVVRTLARGQNVDESVVRSTLRTYASTEDEQLALARTWQRELPTSAVPDLTQAVVRSGVPDRVTVMLESAACTAVFDILRSGQVPDAETFFTEYLGDQVLAAIPYYELQGIAEDFQGLFNDAVAGELTYLDVRFTMMQHQYC